MPKFSYDCSLDMNNVLMALGMPTAFNMETADFSGMGTAKNGNLHISNVIHKTFISVDEAGTKAGAVTSVEMSDECETVYVNEVYISLDRPFVYMIIENETNTPIFIGALESVCN